jgi:hypothetical protein
MNSALRQTAVNSTKVLTRALPLQATIQVSQQTVSTTTLPSLQRTFQTSTFVQAEQHEKDADKLIDRNSLNPSRGEYSKSGTDDEVASHDASFDPSNTSPESEMDAVGRESEQSGKTSNPLDVSPGNKESSKARDPSEGGPERGADREPSARGWTRKRKEVNTGKGQ